MLNSPTIPQDIKIIKVEWVATSQSLTDVRPKLDRITFWIFMAETIRLQASVGGALL